MPEKTEWRHWREDVYSEGISPQLALAKVSLQLEDGQHHL